MAMAMAFNQLLVSRLTPSAPFTTSNQPIAFPSQTSTNRKRTTMKIHAIADFVQQCSSDLQFLSQKILQVYKYQSLVQEIRKFLINAEIKTSYNVHNMDMQTPAM